MYTRISSLTLFIFLVLTGCQGPGNVSPAPIFGDHMVLQANSSINVWGTSDPGARIEVAFRDQLMKGSANGEGRWQITLDSLEYGGPDSMVITSGSDRIVYRDVLVGEVWLCSGQSNMEMPLITGSDCLQCSAT
jgi:sialate O-acetylesterase